ncbi:MAG: DUF6268 family outer membrane beta-barrel protein [Dysgonomonas sp.]|nr:DUF6268 family outer membrane beta-barrel protein [Dysgonomonas sp.]
MKKVLLLVFISIVYTNIEAQIMFKTEYFGTSSYRLSEGDSDEKVGNSKGSAIVYQGGINIPLSMKLNENNRPTMWSISAGGAYAKLNNKNFTEALVIDEIMNIGLSLNHLRPLNKRWSMLLAVGGGIYMPTTRFSEIRYKNILANVGAVFICHLKPNLELGGGIALNNSFGYPMVFPAFYLNWMTEGRYSVKASMMEGLEISAGYKATKFLDLNIVAEMNGQMALFEQDGEDKIFSHQYIVVGFRPEIKIGKHLSIPLTAGIHAIRPAEISDRKLKSMFQNREYYFQVSPYVSAGLTIGF